MSILKVPIELEPMFNSDPANFIRDIANYPQESVNKYFRNVTMIRQAVKRFKTNPFDFDTHKFPYNFRAPNMNSRYMHFDLSLGGDLCCFAMGYASDFTEINKLEEGKLITIRFPYIIIDVVGILNVDRDQKVLLLDIPRIVRELTNKGFVLNLITFDRFQSAYIMQELASYGYLTDLLSIDRTTSYPIIDKRRETKIRRISTEGNYIAAVDSLKQAINHGCIEIPFHKSVKYVTNESQFEIEAKAAEEDIQKKKVDHGSKEGIDLVQAVAGTVFNIVNNETEVRDSGELTEESKDDFYDKLSNQQIKYGEIQSESYLG